MREAVAIENVELSSALHVEPMAPTQTSLAMHEQSSSSGGDEKSRRKPVPAAATAESSGQEEFEVEDGSPPRRLDSLA